MSVPHLRRLRAATVTTVLATGLATVSVVLPPTAATAAPGGAASVQPSAPADSTVTVGGLEVENSFVSSVGWVKPGDVVPLADHRQEPRRPGRPDQPAGRRRHGHHHRPRGLHDLLRPSRRHGGARRSDRDLAGASGRGRRRARPWSWRARPTPTRTNPEIVWRDLSTTAQLTVGGRVQDRHQPRPQGDPAVGDLRHGAVRRPPVPDRPGAVHRPQLPATPTRAGDLDAVDQRPGPGGLHLQPVPGDVARPAVPARHGAVRRRPAPTTSTTPRASPSPSRSPARPATA